jgi:hypothetical protein
MARMSRIWKIATLLAVAGALLLPAPSAVAAGGPVATKSGAIVNYTSLAKLKVGKHIFIHFTCGVDCDVSSTSTIKGFGRSFTRRASGHLPAGVPAYVELTFKGALLKLMKAHPGKFKIVNRINATDPATGATDAIAHTFKLKR